MSELQIGLLAIGALVVAGVLIYNRVQERRARHVTERTFRSGHPDVLMEPSAPAGEREPAPDLARPVLRTAPPDEAARPDPAIDYIIVLGAEHPVAQGALREQWQAIERRHARRALLAGSGDGRSWRAALQMVSRDGAVGEADLIVEDLIVVETKAKEIILPGHEARLRAYLRCSASILWRRSGVSKRSRSTCSR